MKKVIIFLALIASPGFATVNFVNGVAVTTDSTILGVVHCSEIMGFPIVSGVPGMTTPVFVCSGAPLSVNPAATEYMPLTQGVGNWVSSTSASVETPMSVRGTFSGLRVTLETAPGTGASWTYTLMKNGTATALTVTISGAGLTATDSTHTVSSLEGDTVSWAAIPSAGTAPVAPTNQSISCVFLSTSGGESFLAAGSSNNSSTSVTGYAQLWTNTGWGTTEAVASSIVATAGVIDKLRVSLNTAPGTAASGKSYAFTVYKNGAPTSLTGTILETATNIYDSTHAVTVAAGDTISVELVPTGTPTASRAKIGMRFVPTTNGESLICCSGTNPSQGNPRFDYINGPSAPGTGNATASTLIQAIAPVGFTWKKLYTSMSTAAGAAKSRTSRSYINAGYGTLTAAISGASAVTANDTTHSDSVSAGDSIFWATDPAGTPSTLTYIKWGGVMYILP